AGFVGRHLTVHLEDEGDDVFPVDRANGGPDVTDGEAMRRVLDEVRPEAVYHLAGASDVGGSWQHPVETFEANALGTLNLLQACVESGVKRVLVVTSADVYGRGTDEELP